MAAACAHLLPERTAGVLAVLYLMSNEGYSASSGTELIRTGLCDEAIRLARTLQQLMPDEPESTGTLALMLLHHSRRHARVNGDGELITLEEQDRSRWDEAEIEEGLRLLESALRRRQIGPYQLQRRSPPATPKPAAPPTPTGVRSPVSTRCSSDRCRRLW